MQQNYAVSRRAQVVRGGSVDLRVRPLVAGDGGIGVVGHTKSALPGAFVVVGVIAGEYNKLMLALTRTRC